MNSLLRFRFGAIVVVGMCLAAGCSDAANAGSNDHSTAAATASPPPAQAMTASPVMVAENNSKVVVRDYTNDEKKAAKPAGKEPKVDQGKYKSPMALVMHVPKGELRNPYDPHDKKIAKEGHQLFLNHGCSGCHGGDGGGGMCPPLTDDIWSYGDKPDTLYRLITLGSKQLQAKFGYTRNAMQTMKADMPPMGPSFRKNPKDIWKIITWVESKHLNDGS